MTLKFSVWCIPITRTFDEPGRSTGRGYVLPLCLPRFIITHTKHKTQGKDCDRIVFMTDISDSPFSNSMKIEHPGPESYNTMAIKLWSIMKRVYADLSDGFDWIYICGDDTFLMVELLRAYLSTFSTGSPMYVGRRFQYVVFERNARI